MFACIFRDVALFYFFNLLFSCFHNASIIEREDVISSADKKIHNNHAPFNKFKTQQKQQTNND